jgi:hypothetical protein
MLVKRDSGCRGVCDAETIAALSDIYRANMRRCLTYRTGADIQSTVNDGQVEAFYTRQWTDPYD